MDRTTIAPAPEVLFRDLSGEGVLLNLKSGRYYGLDAVGTRVWQILLKGGSPDAAVSELLHEYDVSRAKLEADIGCFLEALEQHGLVIRVPDQTDGEPSIR